MLTMILATALLAQNPPQQLPGIWVLQSATCEGRPVTKADNFLPRFGGIKPAMRWKLLRDNSASFNGQGSHYEVRAEVSEIYAEYFDGKEEHGQIFDFQLKGNELHVQFEEKGRQVEMVFRKD